MMLSFWVTAYYSVLTSWTLFYAFNSFYSPPRWMRCTNTWNTELCHDHSITEVPATTISKLSSTTNNLENDLNLLTSTVPNIMENLNNHLNSSLIAQESGNMNVTHPAVEFLK